MLHYNEPYFKHQPEGKHIMKMDRAESDFSSWMGSGIKLESPCAC